MQLSDVKGLGKNRLQALQKAAILDVKDLLAYLPIYYDDCTEHIPINQMRVGEACCFQGKILNSPSIRYFGKLSMVNIKVDDGTGILSVVWFNQPWMCNQLSLGMTIRLHGRLTEKNNIISVVNPKIVDKAEIYPRYATIKGIPQKVLVSAIEQCTQEIERYFTDHLPLPLRIKYALMDLSAAIRLSHYPQQMDGLLEAARRISFEKLIHYLLAVRASRGNKQQGIIFSTSDSLVNRFIQALPFNLTQAQSKAIDSVRADLSSGTAMNRLLQGDVGSGKTVVALDAAYQCIVSGYQCALMAPTEMLVHQHMKTAQQLFEPLGIRCGLLLGSMKALQKKKALQTISEGKCQLIIGTHALISSKVQYRRLGLVITDEQHRFGVRQRKELENKAYTRVPHTLVLSATPIPRTVALVLYDDLDISIIDSMPAGRLPVITRIVPDDKREAMYQYIRQQALLGNQAYIVCPRLDDGEDEARSVRELFDELSEGMLQGIQLGLAYGSQKPEEKIEMLNGFAYGKISVLIATTVIEVGIDVPNATIMVIENADRFGLSQLHQLRGRVGRGTKQSWCFLLGRQNERLEVMVESNDGFFIAQKDFELRGPGDLLGSRQHGFSDIMSEGYDVRLIEQAKECTELLASDISYRDSFNILTKQAIERYQSAIESTAFN